jgi:RHS repeat-associated protein
MSQSKQSWLIRYHYDPLDQMTSHTVSDTPASLRFYRKNRLTTEIQGAVGYSIVQHDDLLLAQQQHQQNAHDSTLLATDLQRSPLHTLKKNAQPQPIAYSPYGHRSVVSALLSLSGFNGERQDPVTGHYTLGNYRAFNPVLMRFNSPDSWSPFGRGGLNSYAYCMGDPINQTDTTGHFSNGRPMPPLPFPLRVKFAITNKIKNYKIAQMTRKIDKIAKQKANIELSNYERTHQAFKETRQRLLTQPESLQELARNALPEEQLQEFTKNYKHYTIPAKKNPDSISDHLNYLNNLGSFDRNGLLSSIKNLPPKNNTQKLINNYIFDTPEIRALKDKKSHLENKVNLLRGVLQPRSNLG